MTIVRMAWRNVWRNPRRSIVTVAAMTLSVFFMVIYSGLMEGYTIGMERTITRLELGDVQIFAPTYRDKPSLYTRFDPAPVMEKLTAAGYASAPRLLASGLGAADDMSVGVRLIGVDVDAEAQVTEIHQHVHRGEWLDPAAPMQVVVGKRLAKVLAIDVGSELVVLTQNAEGGMADALLHIRGVLQSVSDATDRAGVFLVADDYRTLMAISGGVHQMVVRRPAHKTVAEAGADVTANAPDLEVKTWQQLLPVLADMMVTQRSAITIMFMIMYTAVAIVILNAMLMAVFERVRELGVMKAIGLGPVQVLLLLLLECGLMAGVSMAVAVGASVPALMYLSSHGIDMSSLTEFSVSGIAFDPIWRAQITDRTFSAPVGAFVFIVSIAAVYPALKAARLHPVDAIRHR